MRGLPYLFLCHSHWFVHHLSSSAYHLMSCKCKTNVSLRELAVGTNAYLMGMAALLSASVPHKAEADNGLMLLIFTTVWLLPPSGSKSLGASEKLWHYAGK